MVQDIQPDLGALLVETEFLLVQLVAAHETRGHRTLKQQDRIANLHRRLDQLERKLRRRARQLGEDQTLTLSQLRRRLGSLVAHPVVDQDPQLSACAVPARNEVAKR